MRQFDNAKAYVDGDSERAKYLMKKGLKLEYRSEPIDCVLQSTFLSQKQ